MRSSWFAALVIFSVPVLAQQVVPPADTQTAPGVQPADAQSSDAQTSATSPVLSTAEAAIAKSDWKTAETQLNPWLADHPTDARALFDAGYVADAQNHNDEAISLYRKAITANPKSFEAHLSLGLLLARTQQEGARDELLAATAINSGEGVTPTALGRAWRALAEIDRRTDPATASQELIEAIKITPETPDDVLMAAGLAESIEAYPEAEAAYRRLLAKDPNNSDAQAGLAHLLFVQQKYPEAETLLRSALEKSPDNPALTAQLAVVLVAEDKAEALPLVEKLHAAHPDDAAITKMLAEVYSEAGQYADSDKLYIELLAKDPKNAGLLLGHGQNLIRLLHYPEALATFEQATQADPANGDAWSGLAFAASEAHKPELTIQALTNRAKQLPDNPSTYFLWATAYDALHDRKNAASYYHQFLDSAKGKFPDQEWQARQRLAAFARSH